MSEHEARVPSDPTSESPQSDLTEQLAVLEGDTTVLSPSAEALDVPGGGAVVETSVTQEGAVAAEETNVLEVGGPANEEPGYAAPAAYAPPVGSAPTGTYATPSPAYPQPTGAPAPGGYPAAAPYAAPAPAGYASTPSYGSPSSFSNPPAYGPPSGYPQQPTPPTYGAPQAPLTPENERQIGALSHAVAATATVLSAGFLGFVAALVIYLVYKDRGPFVRANAAAALNVQITMGIGLIISGILMFILIGLITYPIILVGGVVLHILGAVKAWNGEWWTPPMTTQFVK